VAHPQPAHRLDHRRERLAGGDRGSPAAIVLAGTKALLRYEMNMMK
jgi:hypothetical protein